MGILFLLDIRQGSNLQQKTVGITGWLYPGATIKHYAYKKETQFTETIERAIALLYAPIACLYFISPKSRLHDLKTQYCLVVPDITNLELYAQQRQKLNHWNYQQFVASGYSDAGFRLLTQQATLPINKQLNLKRCQVITFGQTQWTGFQKIRQNVDVLELTNKIIKNYQYIDDDLLGFFEAESAKKDNEDNNQSQENQAHLETPESTSTTKKKRQKKAKPKGSVTAYRRGRLDVTRAISTIPYDGKVTFSAKSGRKSRTSIYGTEFHGTRYQYGFGITPDSCQDKLRALALLDAIVSIYRVGGNHGRFLFDFAPESIVLRWTEDFAPRFLYCFDEDEMGNISMPKLSRQIKSGDLEPTEFWIGGEITEFLQGDEYRKVNKFSGVKATADALIKKIDEDIRSCSSESNGIEENR